MFCGEAFPQGKEIGAPYLHPARDGGWDTETVSVSTADCPTVSQLSQLSHKDPTQIMNRNQPSIKTRSVEMLRDTLSKGTHERILRAPHEPPAQDPLKS